MGNEIFLIGAYMVAWVGVAFYVYLNIRKLGMIEQKISDIEEKLAN
jgi:CcmD family protein